MGLNTEFYDVITFGGELKLLNESGIVIPYYSDDFNNFMSSLPDIDLEALYSREIGTLDRELEVSGDLSIG